MAQAKVVISLSDGRFELEGDAEFVSAQLERFESFIKAAMPRPNPAAAASTGNESRKPSSQSAVGLAEFENVFAVADGKVQILKTLPGNSTAEKMVSAALLITYANALNGQDSTTYDSVRLTCKAHGCLDSGNFAKTMKGEKAAFVHSGPTKNQTLTLTVPGRQRAEQLAKSLNVP